MQSVVLAFALSSVLAQVLPDSETIMKQVIEAAGKRQSIEYVFAVTSEATTQGQRGPAPPVVPTVTVSLANPGKMRVEFGTSVRVTDGATTWVYDSATKQYTKTAAGERLHPLGMLPVDWLSRGGPPVSDTQGIPKTIREDTIEVAGKKHECWVVQDGLRIPDAFAARLTEASLTSWIDKELMIAVRNELSLNMAATTPVQLKFTMAMRSLKVDEALPADRFTFTPPPDAREVQGGPSRLDLTGISAPSFKVKDLQGNDYSLDSLKGKPVFLDFWASWCKPCAESTPALERIHAEFKDKGLVMLAVDIGEDRQIVEAFLKPRPMLYPVIMGSEYGMDRSFQVKVFPTFMMISPEGKIVAHEFGYGEPGGEARLRGMIAKAGIGSPVSGPISAAPDAGRAARTTVSYTPAAITFDAMGNLYISDTSGGRVIRVPANGPAIVVAGNGASAYGGDGGPGIFASLNAPVGLALDLKGNLYIADNGNKRIRKLLADGTITTVEIPQLQAVTGMAVDPAGNLYFSESTMHRVRKIAPDGKVSVVAGTGLPGSRGDGGTATAAQLSAPAGLALDAAGNLYIADFGNHRIRKIVSDGTILLAAGNGSQGFSGDGSFAVLAQLRGPSGIAVDPAGNLYISEPQSYRIRKVSPTGTITTLAGTGVTGFAGDGGPAAQSQLGLVTSLASDAGGNLYLADTANARVRRISPDGTIQTVTGTAER